LSKKNKMEKLLNKNYTLNLGTIMTWSQYDDSKIIVTREKIYVGPYSVVVVESSSLANQENNYSGVRVIAWLF